MNLKIENTNQKLDVLLIRHEPSKGNEFSHLRINSIIKELNGVVWSSICIKPGQPLIVSAKQLSDEFGIEISYTNQGTI